MFCVAVAGVITCTSLYKLLTQHPPLNVVIMDTRTSSDYDTSHIRHEACISVPEHILLPGSVLSTGLGLGLGWVRVRVRG